MKDSFNVNITQVKYPLDVGQPPLGRIVLIDQLMSPHSYQHSLSLTKHIKHNFTAEVFT